MKTVVIALVVNAAVAVIKAAAGLLTASAGLLAEAAHSVADCTTELFLVTALRRAEKPADRQHPFGYGKERYFWSLLAALTIFIVGAGFSVYQGLTTILSGESDSSPPVVGYVVIGLSAAVEAVSLVQAGRNVKQEARRTDQAVPAYVRDPDDPTVKSVLLEDIAALTGLGLALAGLVLREVTGHDAWDGIAALAIGALLIVAAFDLARTNVGLLIGKQAHPGLVDAVRELIEAQPEVTSVIEVRTMLIGARRVLLCARLDYRDDLSATDAERASVRLHDLLGSRFAELEDMFLEPVPRGHAGLRSEAHQRAGS